jgi:NAD(P)-dependent dehydrogenase (short-subunit alcohol dehydrogenase family)
MSHWTLADLGDQSGRVAVVTGANSGIGYIAARELARRGATVVLASRDAGRATAAAAAMRSELADSAGDSKGAVPSAGSASHAAGQLETAVLDLADLDSVEMFAQETLASHDRIDLLINNAGVMAVPTRQETAQGFELQFGTNHLGHFALTGRLLPALRDTPGARVVTISSIAHRSERTVDFDDLGSGRRYRPMRAYGLSKLANLLFAFELDRKLREVGAPLESLAAHPGYASTNLMNAGPGLGDRTPIWRVAAKVTKVLAQSADSGALPTLYAATSPLLHGGDFAGPLVLQQWGRPTKVSATKIANDPATAARMWEMSVELTGVSFDALAG